MTVHFYLGSNSSSGFFSLFDQMHLQRTPGERLIILKGGPGTGKSTLMKRIGKELEAKGHDVEYINCSSDPNSLDGLICEELNFKIVDGTAPHTMEPVCPGAAENMINLGDCWDDRILQSHQDEIMQLQYQISDKFGSAYRILSAAGTLMTENQRIASRALDVQHFSAFLQRLTKRVMPKSDQQGFEKKRFISAISPLGPVAFMQTIPTLAKQIYIIDDPYQIASAHLMQKLQTTAAFSGISRITLFSPIHPAQVDHLILPNLSTAFVSASALGVKAKELRGKHIELRRFYSREQIKSYSARIRFNKKAAEELISQACEQISEAKTLHDYLESFYIPAMDFSAVNAIGDKIIQRLLS